MHNNNIFYHFRMICVILSYVYHIRKSLILMLYENINITRITDPKYLSLKTSVRILILIVGVTKYKVKLITEWWQGNRYSSHLWVRKTQQTLIFSSKCFSLLFSLTETLHPLTSTLALFCIRLASYMWRTLYRRCFHPRLALWQTSSIVIFVLFKFSYITEAREVMTSTLLVGWEFCSPSFWFSLFDMEYLSF